MPEDEKPLWHSHHHEVKSGVLVAPGIPDLAEHAYFEDLITTYGKTFHTWQYDRDDFPYGAPQLTTALTGDGQADETLIGELDLRLGVSTSHKRQTRMDIPTPDVAPGAKAGRAAGPCRPAWRRWTSNGSYARQQQVGPRAYDSASPYARIPYAAATLVRLPDAVSDRPGHPAVRHLPHGLVRCPAGGGQPR